MKQMIQSQFFVYLLLLVSAFIILFATKPQYEVLQENLDAKNSKISELAQKDTELSRLNTLKNDLGSEDGELLQEIAYVADTYSDEEVIEYIYSYAQKINTGNERMIVKNLSLSEDGQGDLGFQTLSVQMSAIFSSEKTLFSFMSFITSKEGKYSFQISDFSYPEQESGNIAVNIPLTLYYK